MTERDIFQKHDSSRENELNKKCNRRVYLSKGEKQMDLEKIEDFAGWDFRVFSTQYQIKNRKDSYK